jgi:hypothetical protein
MACVVYGFSTRPSERMNPSINVGHSTSVGYLLCGHRAVAYRDSAVAAPEHHTLPNPPQRLVAALIPADHTSLRIALQSYYIGPP